MKITDATKLFLMALALEEKPTQPYRSTLRNFVDFIHDIDLGQVNHIKVRMYVAHDINMENVDTQKFELDNVKIHYEQVKYFFEWCVEQGFIDKNPTDKEGEIKYKPSISLYGHAN